MDTPALNLGKREIETGADEKKRTEKNRRKRDEKRGEKMSGDLQQMESNFRKI